MQWNKFSAFDPPASEEQRAADVQSIYISAVGQWKIGLEYMFLKIIMISTTSTLTFSSVEFIHFQNMAKVRAEMPHPPINRKCAPFHTEVKSVDSFYFDN